MIKKYKRYSPLFENNKNSLKEAFASGASGKVFKLISKMLSKRLPGYLEEPLPEGYSVGGQKFRSFSASYGSNEEIRINFLLSDSDYIHSVDLFKNEKPVESIQFGVNENVIQISKTIFDLVAGELDTSFEVDDLRESYSRDDVLLERRSFAKEVFSEWLTIDERHAEDAMQREKFTDIYKIFLDDMVGEGYSIRDLPSKATIVKRVQSYLKDNGMTNPHLRAPYKKKKTVSPDSEKPIMLPEEKPIVASFKEPTAVMFGWRESFDDLEMEFLDLMEDRANMPYGQLVYGNGGTGKSFTLMELASKYNSHVERGAPNTKRLVKILYEHRNKDLLVFDDADSIVTNNNSANILKGALDDTIGEANNGTRYVSVPSKTGELKEIETEVIIDEMGNQFEAFPFNASIVIITNLDGIKDKALQSRVYATPIFMTKEDIIDKIKSTVDADSLKLSGQQLDVLAEYLTELIESDQIDVKNEYISYRFFKIAAKGMRHKPESWKGYTLRKMNIGIRTAKDVKKK